MNKCLKRVITKKLGLFSLNKFGISIVHSGTSSFFNCAFGEIDIIISVDVLNV